MRLMYITRTRKVSCVKVKVIDENEDIFTQEFEIPLRNITESKAEKEINKFLESTRPGAKVLKILSVVPKVKRYRMEENKFLSMAEEISPLKRDIIEEEE